MKKYYTLLLMTCLLSIQAQTTFNYDVVLTPVSVSGLPGLHSYAFGQHNGKWLIIGGRKDGLHARQPFNSFPETQNNTDIYVVDVATHQSWSASVNSLPTGLKEQLQSTNMSFYQDENTLFIIGGYGFSTSVNDHVTFANLTSIDVPGVINAIVNGTSISDYFKQITNSNLAITGGQLGKMGATYYLVGGQQFDGRYNPMGMPTYTQNYSNQIRKFSIQNTVNSLSISGYEAVTDVIHLHRRDYNLLPQVFPDGELGYTISSGVFQIAADLPFLYPVDIKASGYFAQQNFNQYLSNYHSGKVGLYDTNLNQMHNLFFGGMSQYHYENGSLIQDDTVPFVKTISRTTRTATGGLFEYQLPVEMPNLKGTGAEFIYNKTLPHYSNEVIQLNENVPNEFVIGHLYGGIESSNASAFTTNQTNQTVADPTVYEVKLVKNNNLNVQQINGENPFKLVVYPNPTSTDSIDVQFEMPYATTVSYYIASLDGKVAEEGDIEDIHVGITKMKFDISAASSEVVILTFVFDNKYYLTEKIIRK